MHYGNVGIGLISGFYNVLLPFSYAKDPNTNIKRLNRNGVIVRNIKFFGFLNVNIEFFLIRSKSCPKNPNGGGATSYSYYYD